MLELWAVPLSLITALDIDIIHHTAMTIHHTYTQQPSTHSLQTTSNPGKIKYYIHLMAFFYDSLRKLDFTGARDDGVVASAGPYANHLHLAPDR